jgi:hypothetical protein
LPGSLSTSIVPSWFFTISRVTARPRPVPLPSGLVVKNVSKIFFAVLFRNAGPRVRHVGHDAGNISLAPHLRTHGQAVAPRHGIRGIGDQIDEDLRQLVAVAERRRVTLVQQRHRLDALRAKLVRHPAATCAARGRRSCRR